MQCCDRMRTRMKPEGFHQSIFLKTSVRDTPGCAANTSTPEPGHVRMAKSSNRNLSSHDTAQQIAPCSLPAMRFWSSLTVSRLHNLLRAY